MTPARQRARKGEGDLLYEEILDAAEELLAAKGSVDAVSMRAVAERVGVTPPSIYLHFTDKDELFFQCCARGFEALGGRMAAAREGGGTVVEQLRRMGRAYVEYGLEKGSQYRVIFGGAAPHPGALEEAGQLPGVRAFMMLVDTVVAGIEAGELRSDVDPTSLAVAIWAGVHGAVLILLMKDEADVLPLPGRGETIEAVLDVLERGFFRDGPTADGRRPNG
jgi:AcrR family transcriptional regulator